MHRVVGSLLTFGQATSTDTSPTDDAPLASVVEAAVRAVRVGMDTVEVEIEVDPIPVDILLDAAWGERILLNLLENAVRYRSPDRPLKIRLEWDAQRYTLTVADNGRGIPIAQRPIAFQPFSRLESATGTEGTGLGLAIVRQYLSSRGGDARIEGDPSEGTRIVLHLPRSA